MIFAIEPISKVWNEWLELAALHWNETEAYRHNERMNPDHDTYLAYEKLGLFVMFTARDKGRLVGSCGVFVCKSLHTQTKIASEDSWFLRTEYRKGWNALEFYRWGEEQLARMGVTRIDVSSKLIDRFSKKTRKNERIPSTGLLLERLGYTKIGVQYSKPIAPPRQGSQPETPA